MFRLRSCASAVGDEPHERALPRAVVEPHRVADRAAELDAELLGDPHRDRARGDPPRLRVRDRAAAELEADLRQLRRLPGAGLARDDHDLVVADRRQQVLAACADGKLRGVVQLRRGDHRRRG